MLMANIFQSLHQTNTIVQESTSPVKQLVSINTDVLALKIDTRGGDIVEAKLLKFDTEQGNGIPFT